MNTRFSISALLAGLVLAVSMSTASAIEYRQVKPDQTSLSFNYQQMGVKMDGQFKKMSAQLSFDPAKPTLAKASFEVDLGSIDLGSSEANQEIASKLWFNTSQFPKANFTTQSVKPLGNNRYEVSGKLTLKGQAKDFILPATFTPQGNSGVFEGTFTLRRGDFNIGEGPWAKFDIVANDIQLRFRITVTP